MQVQKMGMQFERVSLFESAHVLDEGLYPLPHLIDTDYISMWPHQATNLRGSDDYLWSQTVQWTFSESVATQAQFQDTENWEDSEFPEVSSEWTEDVPQGQFPYIGVQERDQGSCCDTCEKSKEKTKPMVRR